VVFEEARKIKNMLIRNIRFAFWKKKVPGEITDMIDLEQEVGVSDATVRAYRSAKTRKEKGEIISELYRETMRQLVEKFPALRQYFPEYDIVRYDIWSDIQDQQRYINMLWDAYRAAETAEEWAIDLIRGEGYRTLDEFRRDIEEEERKLDEMIRELERVAPPSKPERKKKPPAEESERRVREVERELGRLRNLLETTTAEKLRFYVKARLLEKGVSVADARDVTRELESDISDLAARTVKGEITQREAERRLDELIEERVKRPVLERREVIRQLENEYLAYLREQGVTNVRQVLDAVREDVEALADEVVAGRLTLDDAIQRVREIPIPPIAHFRRMPTAPATPPAVAPPPAEVAPAPRPEVGFLSPAQAADLIWEQYLPQLLTFGLRYVFEQYGRDLGVLEQHLSKIAWRLATRIRQLGVEMERRGEMEEKGRLIWAGMGLERYASEIVWMGIVRPMGKIVPVIWPQLRLFPSVVEALEATGIEGSVARALAGVVYDYLGIPQHEWTEDVRRCYDALVQAAGADP